MSEETWVVTMKGHPEDLRDAVRSARAGSVGYIPKCGSLLVQAHRLRPCICGLLRPEQRHRAECPRHPSRAKDDPVTA